MKTERAEKLKKWIKKLGFWGFLFFLVKGLVWLAVGYFIVK
ncbi:MAG: alanyl-tRNA synthetase [Pedobacter sp.]|nr:MAG: alanyl-tRNA synthetase [Pedobacter sp.]